MPKLPDFTALGGPPKAPAGGRTASWQPAAATGLAQGMQEAGRTIQEGGRQLYLADEHASQQVKAANERQDQIVAESAINQMQAIRLELEAGKEGFRNVKGSGVIGPQFTDAWVQRLDDQKQSVFAGLTTENQRRLFEQRSPIVGLQYKSALLAHQAKETDVFNDKTENDSIDLARREMFTNPLDPSALNAGFAKIDWNIDQKAARLGWSKQTSDDTKAKFKDKVYEDMAGILVERNPAQTLAAINKRLGVGVEKAENTGIAAIDNTAPDKLITLRHRANAYITQDANRIRAEAEAREKHAKESFDNLVQFTLEGRAVSPEYQQQISLATSGTKYAEAAGKLVQASFTGAMHGSQPIPNQEAGLRELDAKLAVASDPEQAKLANSLRAITNTQREAYKENPWAAATRFGRQPDTPMANVTDAAQVGQLVAQRLPRMATVEAYAGARGVSPLQPQEAKQYADGLAKLDPSAKSEALAQVGAQLNAPRIAALSEQLDKHDKPLSLALKMGADRTTAGRAASFFVLRGAQALSDKTVKKDDTALAGWKAEIAGLVRGSLGDDRAESDIIDAAFYVRAAQEQEGIAAPGFTKGIGSGAADAIAMVIGKPLERAGVRTFLPRGMDERGFNEKLATYTAEKLKEQAPDGVMYVRGQPVKVEQIANRIPGYGLKRDGHGQYVPSVGNAPITLDKEGTRILRLDVR